MKWKCKTLFLYLLNVTFQKLNKLKMQNLPELENLSDNKFHDKKQYKVVVRWLLRFLMLSNGSAWVKVKVVF